MPHYSVSKIAEITSGKLFGKSDVEISHLVTDSRKVSYPMGSLFFAISGIHHNGNKYIAELYKLGVRAFITAQLPDNFDQFTHAAFILVANPIEALQELTAFHRSKFNYPVIAITGSNGKTVVKEWIYQAIHDHKSVVRSPRSYNSQIGVPLSVWQMEAHHDLALIEAGISQPGEMEKLQSIIKPDIGLITNIGDPHQENFESLEQKCTEKLVLFRQCSKVFYCSDQQIISRELAKPIFNSVEKFAWSRVEGSSVWLKQTSTGSLGTILTCRYNQQDIVFEIPFTDNASVENAMLLITFLFSLNFSGIEIGTQLKSLTPVAMRLELKQGINNCTIINDAYNSDLGSLSIALDYLFHQKQSGLKTVILSDILQSGKLGDDLYREINKLLVQKQVTRLIGIGSELKKCKDLFTINAEFYPTTEAFLHKLRMDTFSNETILLKGSRLFEFERILKFLEKKAHETVLEINLDAMAFNLNYFRSKLAPGVKTIVMVKAFSYGSGSYEIANMLQFQRVDYLAVAFADEGVALRESGVNIPLMVMNPEKSSFETIIRYNLEPEIYSFRVLEQFSNELVSQGITNYPVHIKIDTGMHRLGFMENEIEALVHRLTNGNTIMVKSLFSHLAGSDEVQFDDFTHQQISVFEAVSSKIMSALPYTILRHILNSAGIERFPNAQFDMVRLGIGLYGISATDQTNVKNISTLKTILLQIKEIPVNETVGYSRRYKAQKLTRIGILPIGYADGLHRILGNGIGKVWVNGVLAPIIGSICMDMCMIDVTNIEASEGDDVVVFGENNPITEMAKLLKTIPYEVLTSVSPRVKRVYFQEEN